MKDLALAIKKKKFMHWFLGSQKLKRPDASRILALLLENDNLLARTHFVENVRFLPNALIISAQEASTVSFLCRIDNEYHEDIEEIISRLTLNPPAELFVWLSFDREFLCSLCDVLAAASWKEENPPALEGPFFELERELNLYMLARDEHRAKLMGKIDETLERGDREEFFKLSALYKELFF